MVAVVGPDEARVVVADVFSGDELRAIGKGDVVFGEAFLG